MVAPDGSEWANDCSLCSGARRLDSGDECPYCRAVRYRYGSYFYPIDVSNRHLFVNAGRVRDSRFFTVNVSKEKS